MLGLRILQNKALTIDFAQDNTKVYETARSCAQPKNNSLQTRNLTFVAIVLFSVKMPTYLPADIYCLSHFCVAGPVLQEKQGAAKYSGAVWPAKMWQIDEATCQKMGSKASLVY